MKTRYLATEAYTLFDNKVFASDMSRNGLYVYDLAVKEGGYIGCFPNESRTLSRIHTNAILYKGLIYFVPDKGGNLHVVNPSAPSEIETIPIFQGNDTRNIFAFERNGKIYILRNKPHCEIIIYSIENNEQSIISIPMISPNALLRRDVCFDEDKVYFICDSDAAVYELDTLNDSLKRIEIKGIEGARGFGTICLLNKDFWLSTQREVVRFGSKDHSIDIYADFPEGFGIIDVSGEGRVLNWASDLCASGEYPFLSSAVYGDRVILFPSKANMIVSVDSKDGRMSRFKELNDEENEESYKKTGRITHSHFIGKTERGMESFSSMATNGLFFFDKADIKKVQLPIEEIDWFLKVGKLVTESKEVNVSEYLERVSDYNG